MITHIGFDADDTLWVTEDQFLIVTKNYLDVLSQYGDGNSNLATFYEIEKKNLEVFGYGIKGFILSLIETALYLSDNKIEGSQIKKFIDWGKEMQQAPVKIFPNVKETLTQLKNKYQLWLITKGDLLDQEEKVARSNLSYLFDQIHIVSEKNEDQFSEILHESKVSPKKFVMVGNSLNSDIKPVVSIGAKAIHIPYKYEWQNDTISENEKNGLEYYQVADIKEIPEFVENLNQVLYRKIRKPK